MEMAQRYGYYPEEMMPGPWRMGKGGSMNCYTLGIIEDEQSITNTAIYCTHSCQWNLIQRCMTSVAVRDAPRNIYSNGVTTTSGLISLLTVLTMVYPSLSFGVLYGLPPGWYQETTGIVSMSWSTFLNRMSIESCKT